MAKVVKVIVGSVRTARAGRSVADWVVRQAGSGGHDVRVELVDLKDVNLPFMDEPVSPMSSSTYTHEHTRRWSRLMDEADAYIMVTPEYNRGYSPVLKNAIDFLYREWQGKPVGLVGYGGGGARDALRQLREVLESVGLKPLQDPVGISKIWEAIDVDGNVKPELVRGDIQEMVAALAAS